jgi:hypothetical protein
LWSVHTTILRPAGTKTAATTPGSQNPSTPSTHQPASTPEPTKPRRCADAGAVPGRCINRRHDRSGLALRGTSTDKAIKVMAKPV